MLTFNKRFVHEQTLKSKHPDDFAKEKKKKKLNTIVCQYVGIWDQLVYLCLCLYIQAITFEIFELETHYWFGGTS